MLKASNEFECESCGLLLTQYSKIKSFKQDKILRVCPRCALFIRARNLEVYDG